MVCADASKCAAATVLSTVEALDIFPFEVLHRDTSTSTPLSWLGSAFALGVLVIMSLGQVSNFSNGKKTISRSTGPRDPDTSAIASPFGIAVSVNGRVFYNESFFRLRFTYRAIFHGDSKNTTAEPEFARQYHTLPITDCKVYYDLSEGTNPKKLFFDAPGGKTAKMGCIDVDATREMLTSGVLERKKGTSFLTPDLVIKGTYGQPEYWFVQADLMSCPQYGEAGNITCASETEVEQMFEESRVALEVVSLDSLQPGALLWNNLYVTVDYLVYTAAEMFYRPIHYEVTSSSYPSVYSPTSTTHLTFDSKYFRSQRRNKKVRSFYSIFIRIAEVEESVAENPFSLENVSEGIGAWQGFLWTFVGLICVSGNHLLQIRRQQQAATLLSGTVKKSSQANASNTMGEEQQAAGDAGGQQQAEGDALSPRSNGSTQIRHGVEPSRIKYSNVNDMAVSGRSDFCGHLSL